MKSDDVPLPRIEPAVEGMNGLQDDDTIDAAAMSMDVSASFT
jgi:hypothetical protein